ncbi:hypothetical protein DAA51_36840 [Bradyrhizobium sp. WBAH10]|nr:hypothetical protein [Bradyrhizobium sp. WBAH30]MDD1543434.1 hypothetical protein [Bradyrhizobium sp. WBAH41]MDD1557564.1 hypothetical protein [Bradyrhizobium sp. WBAH23]MDD1564976.1 hypothetical protein [Bradyrhizobium sp. WBAH33]MDD1590384.1 hypothetical protein [Bradyrhizobium sp. WBAH42]NRB88091.1 hypothetical protein [Bradyrhizobium sp. WBAH10]QCJ93443.1 hypothetical protein DAA57_37085 [Bradyrhizobium yuanmingense]
MASSGRYVTQVGVRGALLLLGFAGSLWSFFAFPSFWRAVPARSVIESIIAGQHFKPGVLTSVLVNIDREARQTLNHPALERAEALIQLRIAEKTIQSKSLEEPDRELTGAEQRMKLSLCLNPSDAYLWLMLYWGSNLRSGFEERSLPYLHQSYDLAAMEGWIALRRNKLALAILAQLNESLQEKVVSEFAALVNSGFTDIASANIATVGWAHRGRLLASLSQVDINSRETFARALANDGISVSVPGVEISGFSRR